MNDPAPPIIELFGPAVRHCTEPFASNPASAFARPDTLPYGELKGPGFERLCFDILLSQGYEPRFFGRSGQEQPEVDLLAVKNGRTEVFSCKNLAEPITARLLKERLTEFERKWLGGWGLPKPDRFVICWPQPLRDAPTEKSWSDQKEVFRKRTGGIEADIWHLDLLNGWLKKLPDIVSDLFSNRHAENFCDLDDWMRDLFVPLQEGASDDLRLKRFFERRRSGKLYVDEDCTARITAALEESPVILVRGLPGAGKTFTSLAAAQGFGSGRFRTWFLDVTDGEFTRTQMIEGIRRRIRSRPSVFVLENCHSRAGEIEKVLASLKEDLRSGRARVICLARRVPGDDKSRSDDSNLFEELEARGAIVELEVNDKLLKRLVRFWRDDLAGFSKKRLERLQALCGKNLLLLDEILAGVETPSDIDALEPADLYDRVRQEYFAGNTADSLPETRRLAALAQFEIRPRADVLLIPAEELKLIESLCVKAGTPPRWQFLDSSAAEVVLHALWSGMEVRGPERVAEQAAQDIIDYLQAVTVPSLRVAESPEALETALRSVLRNHLILGKECENALKAAVLDSAVVQSFAPSLSGLATYRSTVTLAAFVAQKVGATSRDTWVHDMRAAFGSLTTSLVSRRSIADLPRLWEMLRSLKLVDPAVHKEVCGEIDATQQLKLIEANGTVVELFKIVENASPDLARALVDALDEVRVQKLIEKTIKDGRSIGTLNLALRKLHRDEKTQDIAAELERKVGAARFLDLIEANGTVFELFKIVENAGPEFARALVDALDEVRVQKLIEKTVKDDRSIGTLGVALFTLHGNEKTQDIAAELERKVGAARFLDLIEANGTVFELFKIVENASPDLARALVVALDEARVQKLIEKTIKDGRSIGTLNLALRKLHRDKKTQDIGADLERKIGAQGFWTLVVGTGSPGPLVDLVRDFSAGFRRDFFASGAEVGREQWEKVLSRGSLFELCELLAERPELFAEATGGQRLLDAVRAMAPILSARSTWYQRNTADKLLANAKESQAKELASGSLNVVLTAIEIESLSIPDLHEAVNRLQLLWERRPDLRSALASRLWGLLPSSDQWQINPKTDMFLPSILLGIVAQPAFSDEDAQCVMQALMRCTTPMKRYKTAGVLWLLWALFACARRRKTQTPKVIGKELHSFLETAAAALETRAAEPCDRDELRARFALIGLLDLLGISVAQPTVHAAGAALAASAQSGAWWLCANQGFVSAWLVLRGIERFRPLTVGLKPHFLERLLSAAAECTDLDPAADYLNSLVQREKADLANTGRPPYRDEVHSLRNPVERSPGTRRRK